MTRTRLDSGFISISRYEKVEEKPSPGNTKIGSFKVILAGAVRLSKY